MAPRVLPAGLLSGAGPVGARGARSSAAARARRAIDAAPLSLGSPPQQRHGRRLASSSSTAGAHPKPSNVLAKPDKFRPPSHGSRLVKGGAGRTSRFAAPLTNYPGPKESQEVIDARKTKRYPHMFPAEGTLMYKFLTSRGIHLWIAMSVLFTLASFTWKTEFARSSPYADLLPTWGALVRHPIDTISQFVHVMKMHSEHVTLETAERRKRNAQDVERRRLYRVAHGLEEAQDGDREKLQALRKVVQAENEAAVAAEKDADVAAVKAKAEAAQAAEAEAQAALLAQPTKHKPVKKWLGIW
ncbi:hypothetical protein KEM52_000689 [Ascosphaera acerosa]|nr:hypothetical protein KEM52_000689 [Ascosphaera acerosa]